jgi:polyisoprenoid-binding protein YceI
LRAVVLVPLLSLSALVAQDASPPYGLVDEFLGRGDHCVAYRTSKRAFFRETEVVGRNCSVSARIAWQRDGAMAVVEVDVAIVGFESGSRRRDRDVAKILRADEHPAIRFRSHPVAVEWLRRARAPGEWRLQGVLEIAGERHPVVFDVLTANDADHLRIDAVLVTTFAELNVVVPRVGPRGIIADPGEDLELLVRLRLDRVEGEGAVNGPREEEPATPRLPS